MAWDFEIILRNKSGIALEYLKKDTASLSWSYDAIGGCGSAEITLRRHFDFYGEIELEYQIEIFETTDMYRKGFSLEFGQDVFGGTGGFGDPFGPLGAPLPMLLAGSDYLRWSGFVREITPVLDQPELVRLRCSGWSRQLEYVIVASKTAPQGPITYINADVGAIARNIIDTFVLPGTQIHRTPAANLCQDTGLTVSSVGVTFETSVWEALKTLAEIGGNAEWGVTADREIYFLPRSDSIKQTWMIGDRVQYLEPSKGSTDEIVHTVILAGNSGFRAVLNLMDPEPGYYKERTISVPAIANADDATLWGSAYAAKFATAKSRGRLILAAIDVEKSGLSNWIERQPNQGMPPLGLLRILGSPIFLRAGAALPFQLDQQLTEATVGGVTDVAFRPTTIQYTPIDGGLKVEIDLGERSNALGDYIRGIEQKLSELRQLAA